MNEEAKLNAVAAIFAIMCLEIAALLCGMDGAIFLTAIAIISGLGGYIVINDTTNALKEGLNKFK
jgi:hypothetical protein